GNFGPLANGASETIDLGNVPPGTYTFTSVYGPQQLTVTTDVTCVEPSLTGSGQCIGTDLTFTITNNGTVASQPVDYSVFGPQGALPGGTIPALNPGDNVPITFANAPAGMYTLLTVNQQLMVMVNCDEPDITPTPTLPAPVLTGTGICIEDDLLFSITNNGGSLSSPVDYTVFGPQGALPGGTIPSLNPGETSPAITYVDVPTGTYTLFTVDQSVTVAVDCEEPQDVCVYTDGEQASLGSGPGFPVLPNYVCEPDTTDLG